MQSLDHWKTRAEVALKQLKDIRSGHSAEVRLLQSALLTANGPKGMGGGNGGRFRLSESAELVERLGRAVLQRDQAFK